jgi:hypothetical protein
MIQLVALFKGKRKYWVRPCTGIRCLAKVSDWRQHPLARVPNSLIELAAPA